MKQTQFGLVYEMLMSLARKPAFASSSTHHSRPMAIQESNRPRHDYHSDGPRPTNIDVNQSVPQPRKTEGDPPAIDDSLEAFQKVLPARYQLIRVLGQGGMGQVILALDYGPDLANHSSSKPKGTLVAIKRLLGNSRHDPKVQERFLSEFHLARKLVDHHIDHVVPMFHADMTTLGPYIVMQYIDGVTLHEYVTRGSCSNENEIWKIFSPLAASLDAAHELKIFHRDIKPSNILIAKNGKPYFIDFGIARQVTEKDKTSVGIGSGTYAYMSPEQLDNRTPEARQDIYSFAATLYFASEGIPPFSEMSDAGLIAAAYSNKAPRAKRVSQGLANSIALGLSKNPAERPKRCVDFFSEENERLKRERQHQERKRRVRLFMIASAIALVAILGWSGMYYDSLFVGLNQVPSPSPLQTEESAKIDSQKSIPEGDGTTTSNLEANNGSTTKPSVEQEKGVKDTSVPLPVDPLRESDLGDKQDRPKVLDPELKPLSERSEGNAGNGNTVVPESGNAKVVPSDASGLMAAKPKVVPEERMNENNVPVASRSENDEALKPSPVAPRNRTETRFPKERDDNELGMKFQLCSADGVYFWIGKYEVTVAQWYLVMQTNPSYFQDNVPLDQDGTADPERGFPVENVSWNKAVEFCRKLTEKEAATGRLPEGMVYRLPWKREWYAAANESSEDMSSEKLLTKGWFKDNLSELPRTKMIGSLVPNSFDIYDMFGNVEEMCLDQEKDVNTGNPLRLVLGGSWHRTTSTAIEIRERWTELDAERNYQGFRVVLGPPENEQPQQDSIAGIDTQKNSSQSSEDSSSMKNTERVLQKPVKAKYFVGQALEIRNTIGAGTLYASEDGEEYVGKKVFFDIGEKVVVSKVGDQRFQVTTPSGNRPGWVAYGQAEKFFGPGK
ncbi:MAG: serine/threonine-protein kinase PknD [Planctomycetota bacterium]|jgi:serine/threonine protein kinase